MGQGLWDDFDDKEVLKFIRGMDLMEFDKGPIAIKRVTYR